MRKTIAALTLTATLAFGAQDAMSSAHRAEDMPCWTWSTMGNLERGIRVLPGSPRIGRAIPGRSHLVRAVDACEFAYALHSGALDPHTPKLRGDYIAQIHGCDYRYFG